jgi:hypothetical protein
MVKKVRFKSPSTHANILASNFWWNSLVQATKDGFHEKRAVELFAKGWFIVVHVRPHEEHKFISWEEMRRKFDLFVIEELAYGRIMSKLEDAWEQNLQSSGGILLSMNG